MSCTAAHQLKNTYFQQFDPKDPLLYYKSPDAYFSQTIIMNKIVNTLLLTLLFLHSASPQVITINPTPPFIEIAFNLSDIGSDLQREISNCLMLLSTGNFLDQNTTIAQAFLRKYTNGTKEYTIFLDKIDSTTNITNSSVVSFGAIIRLDPSNLYSLLDFLTLENIGNGTPSLVSFAKSIVPPLATSLTEVVNKLSSGFNLLKPAEIAKDLALQAIDENIQQIYGLAGSILSYVTSSVSPVQVELKEYRVFYSSNPGTSDFKFRIGSAVYNQKEKAYYIHGMLQVKLPSYITLS